MPARYYKAPEVEAVARPIIAAHHRHLLHVRIEYLFVEKTPTRKGKEVWGSTRKVSSLAAFLADAEGEGEPFFCIVIAAPVWKVLSAEKRAALVDHELMHCWLEEKDNGLVSLVLLPHDLEEFCQIVVRHGLWRDDLGLFAEVASQALQRSLYEVEEGGKEAHPSRRVA